jgi:hypothetical protein
MPANFGSPVKQVFAARQFAEAFGARLISRSVLRLVVVPRLTDTDEPAHARRLSVAEARQVLGANCFTPRDEFWVRPWLVLRQRPDGQLRRQARAATQHIASSLPWIEVSFGVRNPISDLAHTLEEATGGVL